MPPSIFNIKSLEHLREAKGSPSLTVRLNSVTEAPSSDTLRVIVTLPVASLLFRSPVRVAPGRGLKNAEVGVFVCAVIAVGVKVGNGVLVGDAVSVGGIGVEVGIDDDIIVGVVDAVAVGIGMLVGVGVRDDCSGDRVTVDCCGVAIAAGASDTGVTVTIRHPTKNNITNITAIIWCSNFGENPLCFIVPSPYPYKMFGL